MKVLAASCALALLVAGCTSTDPGTSDDATGGGSISIATKEPNNLFPPSKNCAAPCVQLVSQLWTGLVELEDGELQYRVAESITTEDSTHWEIKLKEGWKFQNGEDVDADAFLRAWNWTAYGPNGSGKNDYFSLFEGYDEMQGDSPQATTLSGAAKVDDYTINITLTEPFSQLPMRMLDAPAFVPVSEECMNDHDACNVGEIPVGNGPFALTSWEHDQQIVLDRWEDYPGDDAAKVDQVTFKMYSDSSTAFRDWQAGNLDILAPNAEQAEQARKLAGERVIETASPELTNISLPFYVDYLQDPDVRHALSLAIDRELLIDKLLAGLGEPARSAVAPVIPGGGSNNCDYCEYDPERAKELMPDGALPETITLWAYTGDGDEQWVQAVGDMWRETFGVDYTIEILPFPDHLNKVLGASFTGPYRLGWKLNFPSMVDYLQGPWFRNTPVAVGTGYASDEFEELVRQGNWATSDEEARKFYTEAEKVLLEDMPFIPLFFNAAFYIYSDQVSNVTYDPLVEIDVSKVTAVG